MISQLVLLNSSPQKYKYIMKTIDYSFICRQTRISQKQNTQIYGFKLTVMAVMTDSTIKNILYSVWYRNDIFLITQKSCKSFSFVQQRPEKLWSAPQVSTCVGAGDSIRTGYERSFLEWGNSEVQYFVKWMIIVGIGSDTPYILSVQTH